MSPPWDNSSELSVSMVLAHTFTGKSMNWWNCTWVEYVLFSSHELQLYIHYLQENYCMLREYSLHNRAWHMSWQIGYESHYSVLYCMVYHEFHETCHSVTLYFMKKRLQTMLWHRNARVNSHQRWKQMQFRICFHLWCELTSTMNVTEWQVSWNSCTAHANKARVTCFKERSDASIPSETWWPRETKSHETIIPGEQLKWIALQK